ncbi:MAG: hypothetical protein QM764_07580 [Chitinophagaceae bacterium]
MKRKTIYAVLLVCFAALISSANQNSHECTSTGLSYSQKNCCSKTAATKTTTTADAASVPLNLLLFDL